ncbi:MAG: hypothetical protein AB1941_07030 [Gemmatimonadota bacterium]
MTRPPLFRALLLLSLAACAGEPAGEAPAAGLATRVDTAGGRIVVRSAGTPPAWEATPLASIGSAGDQAEPGPAEFGRVSSLVADREGNAYVADILADEVRVFDARGGFLRTLGRPGRGPGEIGDAYSLAWLGDTLAVMDPRNARIGLFTRSGAPAGSWRWQPLTGTVRFLQAGAAAYVQVLRSAGAGRAPERRFVRFTAAGAGDTVAAPDFPAAMSPVVCSLPDGSMSFFQTPFAPTLVYGFGPGGELVVVPDGGYRIAFLGRGGDTVRVVEREHAAVPVSDGEWEEGLRPYRELREKTPAADCDGEMTRPEHRPAIRHLLFDDGGRMWVESTTPGGFAWDVFDAEGRLLGSLPAPPRAEGVPSYVRGDRLYLVEADSLGVQSVRSYRVAGRSPR